MYHTVFLKTVQLEVCLPIPSILYWTRWKIFPTRFNGLLKIHEPLKGYFFYSSSVASEQWIDVGTCTVPENTNFLVPLHELLIYTIYSKYTIYKGKWSNFIGFRNEYKSYSAFARRPTKNNSERDEMILSFWPKGTETRDQTSSSGHSGQFCLSGKYVFFS